jgi:hypothetical protein
MTALAQLSYPEVCLLLGLIALIGWELNQALSSHSWVSIYRPTLFVAVIFGYYVLVGPRRNDLPRP